MTDVRRVRLPLLWSTVRETALAKCFCCNVGDTKYIYPCVCRRLGLPRQVKLNPFAAMLTATPSLLKRPIKVPNIKSLNKTNPSRERVKRFLSKCAVLKVDLLSNILFASVYVCTFQPGNFTGWGSEEVKGQRTFQNSSHICKTIASQKYKLSLPELTVCFPSWHGEWPMFDS